MNWKPTAVRPKGVEKPKETKPCLMYQGGDCDQTPLLPRLPENAPCYVDGECLPRKLFPVEAVKLGTKAACH